MSIDYSAKEMLAAQRTVDEVVKAVREMKAAGTYQELLERCKERFISQLSKYQDKLVDNGDLASLINTDFESIPGSYRLSLLLSCYGFGSFDVVPDPGLRAPQRRRFHQKAPPILRIQFGVSRETHAEMIGLAMREKTGCCGRDTKSSKMIGQALETYWPSEFVDELFNAVGRQRPILRKYLKTDQYWKDRGLAVLDVKVDEEWYHEGDQSRYHNVIFPLRLLKEEGDRMQESAPQKQASEQRESEPEEDYVNEGSLMEEWLMEQSPSKSNDDDDDDANEMETEDWDKAKVKDKDAAAGGESRDETVVEDAAAGGKSRDETVVEDAAAGGKTRDETLVEETVCGLEDYGWETWDESGETTKAEDVQDQFKDLEFIDWDKF